MKTNQSNDSRSEHARNEKRDSEGRFESESKSGMKNQKSSDSKMNHRGDNAKNEPRDSHGRFESEDKRKK